MTVPMEPIRKPRGWVLDLGDGLAWKCVCAAGAAGFLAEFARILQLTVGIGRDRPVLGFAVGQQESAAILRRIAFRAPGIPPPDQWTVQRIPNILVYRNPLTEDLVCEIGAESAGDRHLKMSSILDALYGSIQKKGGFPMHAALIVRRSAGILVGASGGTGKSTCCRRLPSGWKALADDAVLIMRRCRGGFAAQPLPTWSEYLIGRPSGRTWPVSRKVPVRAVFFLERADADQAVLLGQGAAAVRIHRLAGQLCTHGWHGLASAEMRRHSRELFQSAGDLALAVPCFVLRATLTGRFWLAIEQSLRATSQT